MANKAHLIVIDPQNDFCDPKGALYVNGSDKDMNRLATMVGRLRDKLHDIHVTLDSHQAIHIAHPVFWKNSAGQHPNPFTIISAADVRNGTWTTSKPGLYKRALAYVEGLEKNSRYPLCIWPPHCLIGSWGHGVWPALYEKLMDWSNQRFGSIDFVTKGSNILTEHYSAIQADVPDPSDPGTQINTGFLQTVNEADIVLLAGEAGSHCLANTGRDMVNYFPDDSFVKKLVLLTDATSPVPGFEKNQDDFIKEMVARGMKTTTTTDFLA
jgi:nicotinamidase-related amidase